MSTNVDLASFWCYSNSLTTLDLRGMRLVTNLEITTRGSGTNNSGLTTLLLHDNLKTNSEVRTVKTARGNGLTISTYSVNTTNSEYTKTCSNWNPAGEGSCITP